MSVWKAACEWGPEKGSRAEAPGRGGRRIQRSSALALIRGDSRASVFYGRDGRAHFFVLLSASAARRESLGTM